MDLIWISGPTLLILVLRKALILRFEIKYISPSWTLIHQDNYCQLTKLIIMSFSGICIQSNELKPW